MYSHPLAGLTSWAAIRARLVTGLVYFALGLSAAALLFQLGAWA
jgi:hypothetical protein